MSYHLILCSKIMVVPFIYLLFLLDVSFAVSHSVSVIDEFNLKTHIPEPLTEVSSVSSPGSVKALQSFNVSVTDGQPVNQLINPFQVWRQTAQLQQMNLVKYDQTYRIGRFPPDKQIFKVQKPSNTVFLLSDFPFFPGPK